MDQHGLINCDQCTTLMSATEENRDVVFGEAAVLSLQFLCKSKASLK